MVVLNRIYTRTGDDGSTALGNGERRPKFDLRVATYGTVDELNACVGMARLQAGAAADLDTILGRIQNELFDLGADLATPAKESEAEAPQSALRIVASQVDHLEDDIDALNKRLAPLRTFVLPGGSALAAHLHLARTVCRRAERDLAELATREEINPVAIHYVNRLSDFLFVAARIANADGTGDVLWVPGATR